MLQDSQLTECAKRLISDSQTGKKGGEVLIYSQGEEAKTMCCQSKEKRSKEGKGNYKEGRKEERMSRKGRRKEDKGWAGEKKKRKVKDEQGKKKGSKQGEKEEERQTIMVCKRRKGSDLKLKKQKM